MEARIGYIRQASSAPVVGATGEHFWSTFYFWTSFDGVRIINRSNTDLQLGTIDLVHGTITPEVVLYTTGTGETVDIEFDLVIDGAAADIEIHNLGTGDVIFTGTGLATVPGAAGIENPIGSTTVTTADGSILQSTAAAELRTNRLELTATGGSVGSADLPVQIQLVDALSCEESANITATGDVWIDVQGRLRRPLGLGETFEVRLDLVSAGGRADVLLRAAVKEGAPAGLGAVLVSARADGIIEQPYRDFFLPEDSADNVAPAASVSGAFADFSTATAVAATYVFLLAQAGDNIDLHAQDPTPGATTVNILAWSDITAGGGHVDAKTNGFITITEIDAIDAADPDDLRIGLIWSTASVVTLRAPHSLVDADEGPVANDPADVIGLSIMLFAETGSIGSADDFLETDLLGDTAGGNLTARARQGVYIEETSGDLRVDVVTTSDAATPTALSHVTLATRDGWIVNGTGATTGNVIADVIELVYRGDGPGSRDAPAGGVGLFGGDFFVDTSSSGQGGAGHLYVDADGSVYVTEVADELTVLALISHQGHVRITVPDTDSAHGPPDPSDTNPQDLVLLSGGSAQLVQAPTTTPVVPSTAVTTLSTRGGIWALLDIYLWVGDDVETGIGSEIVAGGTIVIRGDTNRVAGAGSPANDTPSPTTPDDAGSTITLRGTVGGIFDLDGHSLETDITLVFGNADADTFNFTSTFLGAKTRAYGSSSSTTLAAADSADAFFVFELQTMAVADGHTLTLDGQQQGDTYQVTTTGSQGLNRHYVINVLDTGTSGTDVLTVLGTESSNDVFLLRKFASLVETGWTPVNPAFVALLHDDITDARTHDPLGQESVRPQAVQRINYDSGIDDAGGGLFVRGLGGADTFATDDNSAPTELDGGDGNDTFLIGQLYGSPRTVAAASLVAADVFATTTTTRGWLSNGNSRADLRAVGGIGNDDFVVYANRALATLLGGDGNDRFTLRSFALANATAACDTDASSAGCVMSAALVGGLPQYAPNALVVIDGERRADIVSQARRTTQAVGAYHERRRAADGGGWWAMMSSPSILMLDEPSLGLAPLVCRELFRSLARIKETGVGIFLVEQNAKQGLSRSRIVGIFWTTAIS